MKAHQEAKAAGLKNLLHMEELTGQSTEKLKRWHEKRPKLFKIIIFGCQKVLESQDKGE